MVERRRYGGEEFIMVLPGADLAGTSAMAERLRRHLADQPAGLADATVCIAASFGLACSTHMAEPDPHLLRAADGALYRAKAGGRNRVEAAVDADYAPEVRAGT